MLYDPTGKGTLEEKGERFLTMELMELPELIKNCTWAYENADRDYQVQFATISLMALNEPMFAGKDGERRCASNEMERSLAVSKLTLTDTILYGLETNRLRTLTELQEAKNRFEAARLLVQLLCRKDGK